MKSNDEGYLINEGIAKALNTGKADIAISLFEMLPYRIAGPYGVRFLHAVYKPSKAIAVFSQPPKHSMRNLYGLPFQNLVWGSLLVLYLFLLMCISLFLAQTPGGLESSKGVLVKATEVFQQAQHWILCIATRQSFSSDSTSPIHLKIVIFTCFISSVTLHSVYSSALTSILAVDYEPISSFLQLVHRRYILYFDKYVPSIESVLKGIHEKDIFIREMGNLTSRIMQKAIPEILQSKSVLLTSLDRYYPFFKDKYHDSYLCSKLSMVPLTSEEIPSANFVKQGSKLRDLFNIKLLLMRQSGLIDRVYSEYNLKRSLTCIKPNDFPSLDVYDTSFPFFILLIMALVALIILPCEVIIRPRKSEIFLAFRFNA
ncbi:unnamed protein product [Orchesella dallaii]|uniref:Uncharacterized protein n=1 Tax=Orchesella dallaii TaxID=48710 RepID=A0ABP1REZ1_9HEXA